MRAEKSALLVGLALGIVGMALVVGKRRRGGAERLIARMNDRLRRLEGARPAFPQA